MVPAILNIERAIMGRHNTNTDEGLKINESHRLTHIDGFLVTDGEAYRLTISARLTSEEKERGVQDLLKKKENTPQAGVYLWSIPR